MRLRVRRREHTFVGLIALFFIVGMVGVNTMWPTGFSTFVAIGGAVGALMVLYEVRLTKAIAQAEFIRDLQTSFATDSQVMALWSKMLRGEEITAHDRPLMSSYLTFFETIYLLQIRGALDLGMIDDLFRNRFFTAVGHPAVLEHALLKSASAFVNIHALIDEWYRYIASCGVPLHPGYFAYLRSVAASKGLEIRELDVADIDALMGLQGAVMAAMPDRRWLRENSRESFLDCLGGGRARAVDAVADSDAGVTGHLVLGAWSEGKLVSAAILFDPGDGPESIKRYLTDDSAALADAVNLKLVLADPSYRRARGGTVLVKLLEERVYEMGRAEILCTIHPRNAASIGLFTSLGYSRVGRARASYGSRAIYSRRIRRPKTYAL